jgi:hypothetical protein
MGTLRSDSDHSGLMFNGITLGQPARDMDDNDEPIGEYRWDDSRLPNGVVEDDGTITLDETEVV